MLEDRTKHSQTLRNNSTTLQADQDVYAEHLHLYEKILYTERLPLNENELFQPQPDEAKTFHEEKIKRVLIRGQAGIGKTTFCYHFARKLIEKSKDQWIFVIPLRNLREESGYLDDAKVLRKIFNLNVEEESLRFLLNNTNTSPYWLLDGYDEVANLDNHHPLKRWLESAFTKINVILTTRPRAVNDFVAQRLVEMVGYAPEDVSYYIDKYFKTDVNKSTELKNFLYLQKQLSNVARIPIVLELLCWSWRNSSILGIHSHDELSLTELYSNIFLGLGYRYLEKAPSYHSAHDLSNNDILKILCDLKITNPLISLAYDSFKDNKFILTGREVEGYLPSCEEHKQRKQIVEEFGFMRILVPSKHFDTMEFSFTHLTFQEFLAAKRWVALFTSQNAVEQNTARLVFTGTKKGDVWQNSHKYDKRFELIWVFVAGLLKNNINKLNEFLDLIDSPPYDIIGARHVNLLLQIVGETSLYAHSREMEILIRWFSSFRRDIDIQTIAKSLSRYPIIINHLDTTWNSIWNDYDSHHFFFSLLSYHVPIFSDARVFEAILDDVSICHFGLPYSGTVGYLLDVPILEQELPTIIKKMQEIMTHGPFPGEEYWGNILSKLISRLNTKKYENIYHKVIDDLLICANSQDKQIFIFGLVRTLVNLQLPICYLDKVIELLRKGLNSENERTKKYAARYLQQCNLDSHPEMKKDILNCLFDYAQNASNTDIQFTALKALCNLGISNEHDMQKVTLLCLNAFNKYASTEYFTDLITLYNFSFPEACKNQIIDNLLSYLNDARSSEQKNIYKNIFAFEILKQTKLDISQQKEAVNLLVNYLEHDDYEIKKHACECFIHLTISKETQACLVEKLLSFLQQTLRLTRNETANGRIDFIYSATEVLANIEMSEADKLKCFEIVEVCLTLLMNKDLSYLNPECLVSASIIEEFLKKIDMQLIFKSKFIRFLPNILSKLNDTNRDHYSIIINRFYSSNLFLSNKSLFFNGQKTDRENKEAVSDRLTIS